MKNLKSILKRGLSILIVATLCAGMMPFSAFAAEGEEYTEPAESVSQEAETVEDTTPATEANENTEAAETSETTTDSVETEGSGTEDIDTPEAPETQENEETTETDESADAPADLETPDAEGNPDAAETPEITEAPEAVETPEVTETPEVPETTEAPADTAETMETVDSNDSDDRDPVKPAKPEEVEETEETSEVTENPETEEVSELENTENTEDEGETDEVSENNEASGTGAVQEPETDADSEEPADGETESELETEETVTGEPEAQLDVETVEPVGAIQTFAAALSRTVEEAKEAIIKTWDDLKNFFSGNGKDEDGKTTTKGRLDENFVGNTEVSNESFTVGSGLDLVLNLSGQKLQSSAADSVISVNGKLTLNDDTVDGAIKRTGNTGCVIAVNGGGKFIMNGGIITGGNAVNGGGVAVTGNSYFEMNGGLITGNTATRADGDTKNLTGLGGGVYVAGGVYTKDKTDSSKDKFSTGAGDNFVMNGGIISNNTAAEGGGIFVTNAALGGHWKWESEYRTTSGRKDVNRFTMNGGVVSGNTATTGEGGGIYISNTAATINGGAILNNKTETTADLGGGGIYIEHNGKLSMKNVVVTGNEANGMGAGIASCANGNVTIYAKDGAAIFGNEANKAQTPPKADNDAVDGNNYWLNEDGTVKTEAKDFVNGAVDIFTTGDANATNRASGTYVSNTGLNGFTANWTGNKGETVNGSMTWSSIIAGVDPTSERFLGLTAQIPDEETKKALIKYVQSVVDGKTTGVLIQGNESSMHGGGIAANGVLVIGTEGEVIPELPELSIEKDFVFGDGEDTGLNLEDAFEFELKYGDNSMTLKTDKDGKVSFESIVDLLAVKDKDGKVITSGQDVFKAELEAIEANETKVKYPTGYETEEYTQGTKTYTFTVSEKIPTDKKDKDGNIIYDETVYEVTFTVTKHHTAVKFGNKDAANPYTVKDFTTYSVSDPVFTKVGEKAPVVRPYDPKNDGAIQIVTGKDEKGNTYKEYKYKGGAVHVNTYSNGKIRYPKDEDGNNLYLTDEKGKPLCFEGTKIKIPADCTVNVKEVTFTNKYNKFELDLSKVNPSNELIEGEDKTDESGNVTNSSTTEFTLVRVTKDKDGNEIREYCYWDETTGKYEWNSKTRDIKTITVKNGKLEHPLMLDCDGVYLLQEKLAPEDYQADPVTYVISNEKGFAEYAQKTEEQAEAWLKQYQETNNKTNVVHEKEQAMKNELDSIANALAEYLGKGTPVPEDYSEKLTWVNQQIDAIKKELDEVGSKYNSETGTAEVVEKLNEQVSILKQFEELSNLQSSAEDKLNSLESSLKEFQDSFDKKQFEYTAKADEIEKLVAEKNQKIQELEDSIKEVVSQANTQKAEYNTLLEQFNSLKASVENEETDYSDRRGMVSLMYSLKSQMEEIQKSLAEAQEAFDSYKSELADVSDSADVDALLAQLDEIKKAADAAASSYKDVLSERDDVLEESGITELLKKLEGKTYKETLESFESLSKQYKAEREAAVSKFTNILSVIQSGAVDTKTAVDAYVKAYEEYQRAAENLASIKIFKSIYSNINQNAFKDLVEAGKMEEDFFNSFAGNYGWVDRLTSTKIDEETQKLMYEMHDGKGSLNLTLGVNFINHQKLENTSFDTFKPIGAPIFVNKPAPDFTYEELNAFDELGLKDAEFDPLYSFEMPELPTVAIIPDIPTVPSDDDPNDPTPETPTTPDETPDEPISDEPVPLAELPDEDVPLADLPDEDVPLVDLPDEDIPLAAAPQTGDTSMTLLYAVLLLCGGMLMLLRKKDEEEA